MGNLFEGISNSELKKLYKSYLRVLTKDYEYRKEPDERFFSSIADELFFKVVVEYEKEVYHISSYRIAYNMAKKDLLHTIADRFFTIINAYEFLSN